jgi:hypothetical protein
MFHTRIVLFHTASKTPVRIEEFLPDRRPWSDTALVRRPAGAWPPGTPRCKVGPDAAEWRWKKEAADHDT